MAMKLTYDRLSDDEREAEVEILGETYTIPLPSGLTTDEATHILDLINENPNDDNVVGIMRGLFDGWVGEGVVGKMPLGDFKSLASAWIQTMQGGAEELGE